MIQIRVSGELAIDGNSFTEVLESSTTNDVSSNNGSFDYGYFDTLFANPGGEISFSNYIRPICLPCSGTCVKPDDIRDENGNKLLTGDETPEEACKIESRDFFLVFKLNILFVFKRTAII